MKRLIKKSDGFSLVELMVVTAILAFMVSGVFMTLSTGKNAWFDTDDQIRLHEQLRKTMQRVLMEVRQSGSYTDPAIVCPGSDPVTMYIEIDDNSGVGGSDILRFSMPVVCESGGSLMTDDGDVAYWRAPLTWGCASTTCMDADDDCSTEDYSEIQYLIDDNDHLLRQVLDANGNVVRTDIFAQDITDFQAVLNTPAECDPSTTLSLTVEGTRNIGVNAKRSLTITDTQQIVLRNRG